MLASMQVPEHDGPVIPATGEPAPIGTHLQRPDRPLMPLLHPPARPAVHLPPAEHAVTASTDQQLPTGTPGYRRDDTFMPRKGSHALPALHVPHKQLPAVSLPLAAATRGQPRPIGVPRHPRDDSVMSRQPLLQRAIRSIPQVHAAIITPADQPCAVRTPCHATDPGRELTPNPTAAVRGHLPHQHAMHIGSTGQALSVRTPRHSEEVGGIVGVR